MSRKDQPSLDGNTFISEGSLDSFRDLSRAVVDGSAKMGSAFVNEHAIGAKLLENLREAIADCLPIISSKLPKYAGEGNGVFLLERRGEKLFLLSTGSFLQVHEGDRAGRLMNPREVMEARWSIREIALALAEEMSANIDGQTRQVERVERMARKMSAVAELLAPEK